MPETKQCNGPCGEVKPLEVFYRNKGCKRDGRQGTCKECMDSARRRRYSEDDEYRNKCLLFNRQWQRENQSWKNEYLKRWAKDNLPNIYRSLNRWKQANPDKVKLYDRKKSLKRDFGMSLTEYEKMFGDHGGRCALCSAPQESLSKALGVDHNHATGAVRGLLCSVCNLRLGKVEGESLDKVFMPDTLWRVVALAYLATYTMLDYHNPCYSFYEGNYPLADK
jgi:hypothetical protein